MNDNEIILEIDNIYSNVDLNLQDEIKIVSLINQLQNINVIFCTETENKNKNLLFYFITNTISNKRCDFVKNVIQILVNKNIDKNYKYNYNSFQKFPILFFTKDDDVFEYLCSLNFDPNYREDSVFVGCPYFVTHLDFNLNTFLIAKKYGFDSNLKIAGKNILTLIIARYINTMSISVLDSLLLEFDSFKNEVSGNGEYPIHTLFKLAYRGNFDFVELINLAINTHRMNPFNKLQEEAYTSDLTFSKGSNLLDILTIEYTDWINTRNNMPNEEFKRYTDRLTEEKMILTEIIKKSRLTFE